ncbi:SRPBCC family protein [Streptomyces lasiicapitis]|uniref:Cyclase n=1 Tax=Streptomyces lasiicapitis TaxID=1923961 RepID=A0ABQ2MMD9_9ACTN|nr:SRPBCC family protein [Streptomyces lasiicapitis]GGO54962.1 cyclase [Streptomyces lasiicapitis]
MEWTGVRYAEGPTVEVRTWIDAPPGRVWDFVSDIARMPERSGELRAVEWLDGAVAPTRGACFAGHNKHEALGEWTTVSHVVECEAPRVFGWAVTDPEHPTATWRFSLRERDGGTELTHWMRMGPARSGISLAIERMPEKEQKIVFVRMRELEQGMRVTVDAIKGLAESGAEGVTGVGTSTGLGAGSERDA